MDSPRLVRDEQRAHLRALGPRPPSNLEGAFQRARAPQEQDDSLRSRRGALTQNRLAFSPGASPVTLVSRGRNHLEVVLDVKEESSNERGTVKRITRIRKPFRELYGEDQVIIDGGEQCRIKRVRSTTDGKNYVVKMQLKAKIRGRNEPRFRRMTERMMNLPESPNVVKVFACYEDEKYFYTLLESLQGGDCYDFFQILTSDSLEPEFVEREVRKVMVSLLESLQHLHNQGLIHKDVKLENIVFKAKGSSTVKKSRSSPDEPVSPTGMRLIDFDFLDEWEPSSPKSKAVLGTDGYIAPEAYLGDACPKSDVFSTGVVMYLLIAGRFPFDDAIFDDGPNENYVGS